MYLAVSRAVYGTYNRLDAEARGLPYAFLQIMRTVGYDRFLRRRAGGCGHSAVVVVVRWAIYISYRDTGPTPARRIGSYCS